MSALAAGWVDAATAAELEHASGLTRRAWLLSLIDQAKVRSRAPLSRFHVGAAGLGASGAVYLGTNIEFSSSQLSQTIHAEQAVVINAMNHAEARLEALAVSAPPCGPCRQFLNELTGADSLTIWLSPDKSFRLDELLPQSFGPHDLGFEGALLGAQDHALQMRDRAGMSSAIAQAAVNAANRCYAPYTRAFAGCALEAADGSIWPGSYVENAAFNPSLTPAQSALTGLVVAGHNPSAIRRAVLAEVPGGPIDHQDTLRQMLTSLDAATAGVSVVEIG